jgi:predicted exporter
MKKFSNTKNANTSGGVTFLGLLLLVFITLKLTGFINWSWLWVLSPFWLPIALGIIIFFVICFIAIIVEKI